jgi:hypothetical protein
MPNNNTGDHESQIMSSEELPGGARIEQKLANERDVREHFLNRSYAMGLYLVEGQERYPDLHMRDVETDEDVFVEVEHLAANFISHGHHKQEVENEADLVICGANNLSEADAAKVPLVQSLEELFDADVAYTPTYRVAAYESTPTRRKSIALRVDSGRIDARMEDEDREQGDTPGGWRSDSPTWWVPIQDFTALFRKLSQIDLREKTLGESVFAGEEIEYEHLVKVGRQESKLQSEGDRAVLASHTYVRPGGAEVTAKAVLRVNADGRVPNFRIQHFEDGEHRTQKTTIYSRDEFIGVFNKLDRDIREDVFVEGDPDPLMELVERLHSVSFSAMTN